MPSVLGYLKEVLVPYYKKALVPYYKEVLVPYYKELQTLPSKNNRTDDVVVEGEPVFFSLSRSLQFPGMCFPIT